MLQLSPLTRIKIDVADSSLLPLILLNVSEHFVRPSSYY